MKDRVANGEAAQASLSLSPPGAGKSDDVALRMATALLVYPLVFGIVNAFNVVTFKLLEPSVGVPSEQRLGEAFVTAVVFVVPMWLMLGFAGLAALTWIGARVARMASRLPRVGAWARGALIVLRAVCVAAMLWLFLSVCAGLTHWRIAALGDVRFWLMLSLILATTWFFLKDQWAVVRLLWR